MLKHFYTDPTEINFSKLEERILQINTKELPLAFYNQFTSLKGKPTLIVATGGSIVVAYYLKEFLETNNIICEVIKPRDYYYKSNVSSYYNLIAISNSGTSNGILDILKDFKGNAILITGEYKVQDQDHDEEFKVIKWGNEQYLKNKEKSFISMSSTLGPMLMFLETSILIEQEKDLQSDIDIEKINIKIKQLIAKSQDKIARINYDFKKANLIQVIYGYDTNCAAVLLESNIIETGASSVVIHDKGDYCHGRSNLLFQNPDSPIIYLAHQMKKLDEEILTILKQEYSNVFLFDTFDEETSKLWKEYYLVLQMYYLSKNIADDRGIDLTMPEYNQQVVKKLYRYRGEM